MKRLVRPLYALAVLGSLLRCGTQRGDATDAEVPTTGEAYEPTKLHEVLDPQSGMVQMRVPIPESWQVHGREAPFFITSPRGLQAHHAEHFMFGWSPDPAMQQTFAMSGHTVAPPVPLAQIVDEQVAPNLGAEGFRLVGSFDALCTEALWQRLIAAMPPTGTTRAVDALATEWEAESGTRAMIVLVQLVIQSPQSLIWQLFVDRFDAPAEYYEAAKQASLYSAANAELNPHWIAASNRAMVDSIRATQRYWDNATEISRRAHQQRMQSIAARGAAARSAAATYGDILDISHEGYLGRDSVNDQGHAALVDSISGTTVISNHETGEHYDVQADTAFYWVDADGYYIATDDALFDPRTHEATKDADWTRFHKER